MKAFLDTSVLVAAFYADHEHHAASLDLLLRHGKRQTCCAAHTLAEIYATLTGMPGKRRVNGDQAMLFLGSIEEHATTVALDEQDYVKVAQEAAEAGFSGGAIYDAILGRCAIKARAQAIYTWNEKDFLRLPGDIANRVKKPFSQE